MAPTSTILASGGPSPRPSPRQTGESPGAAADGRTPTDETQSASASAMMRGPMEPTPSSLWWIRSPVGESGASSTDPHLLQGEHARLSTYSRLFTASVEQLTSIGGRDSNGTDVRSGRRARRPSRHSSCICSTQTQLARGGQDPDVWDLP